MSEIERSASKDFDEDEKYHCEDQGQSCDVYFWLRTVPDKWLGPLWELYLECLSIEEAVQDQLCFDRETLQAALKDPEFNKVLLVLDGKPVGLLMATYNLDKASVGYINPDFIRNRFPEEVAEGRFWYIPCLFMSPRLRNVGLVRMLIKATIDAIRERGYIIAFDVSDSRLFLPEFLVRQAEQEGFPLEKLLLGTQSYFAFQKPREG